MKLMLKNMVCRHCMHTVHHVLADMLGLKVVAVELGMAEIESDATPGLMDRIEKALTDEGFELIQTREAEIVESVKHTLIELVRSDAGERPGNLADVLSCGHNLSYASISRLFSSVEGRTIESYYMALRIERVKELVKYGRMSLSEIAYVTGFSSVAHLSRQFKQLTGMTPTQFRDMGRRRSLPEI